MSEARPVLFGEVLFDRFPAELGGEVVLGGAPFNVAWHLQAFGLRPLFLSRVGDDPAGREVLGAMGSWGMDVSGVQVDPEHPTGAVEVRIHAGEPGYDILADQAYDHIDAGELPPVPQEALFCHGTLALRAETSRAALDAVLGAGRSRRIVDVNLRAPWWERDEVLRVLRATAVIKLNEHELAQLADAPRDPGGADAGEALEVAARSLLEVCDAERIVVTRGERGTIAYPAGGAPVECVPSGGTTVVDTVGAGDAFTAVMLLGECRGWSLETTLRRGADFAEAVLGLRGATTADPGFYSPFLLRWKAA